MNGIIPYALFKKVAGYAETAEEAATNAGADADRAEAAATIAQSLSQTVYMGADGKFYIDEIE